MLALSAALGCGGAGACAQDFAIDWHSINSGGGAGTGGMFSLSGSIGQSHASAQPMTGGNFSLTSGFWSLFAVQTPNAPALTIRFISVGTAQVSWPSPSTGFVLQQSSDLNSNHWANAPQAVTDDGVTKSIAVNPPAAPQYYRLFKP